jgi:hypothetical protein
MSQLSKVAKNATFDNLFHIHAYQYGDPAQFYHKYF